MSTQQGFDYLIIGVLPVDPARFDYLIIGVVPVDPARI